MLTGGGASSFRSGGATSLLASCGALASQWDAMPPVLLLLALSTPPDLSCWLRPWPLVLLLPSSRHLLPVLASSWSPLLSSVFSSPTPPPVSKKPRPTGHIITNNKSRKNNLLCAPAFHITTVIRESLAYWYFHGILTFSLHLPCARSESRQICWYR